MKKLIILLLLLLATGRWVVGTVSAQTPTPTPGIDRTQECQYAFSGEKQKCLDCVKAGKAWTVFGCLPIEPTGFSTFVLRFAIGIGGGIAFLMMLAGAFTVITSAGDPEKLKQGKRTITKAAIGLLVIIFAIFILRLIGQQLLGLPGV